MSLLLNLGNSITAGTDPYQFYNFRERVLADGATVLSDTQVSDEIKRLRSLGLYSKFSALYTPAVRNTSKLYSIISADGDATVTRGSVKNINSATGTLEEIASDVTPSSFGTGGWGALVEGARTNLLQRSEDISVSPWSALVTGVGITPTVTANAGVAPSGATTATRIQLNCGGGLFADRSIWRQSTTVGNGTTYAQSVYVKAFSSGEVGKTIRFTIEGTSPSASTVVTLTADWQRVAITGTTNTTTAQILIETRGTITTQTADILVWGAQLEAGSFASSYMKTEGATFTRSADVITKTGASDLIGQTEGTLFAVVDLRTIGGPSGGGVIQIRKSGGTTAETDRLLIFKSPVAKTIVLQLLTVGSVVVYSQTFTPPDGIVKIAWSYKTGESYLRVNNVGVSLTQAFAITTLLSDVRIGSYGTSSENFTLNDRIPLAGISKTALTQAEAIALTT
jgi:hypothetical protein